MRIITTGLVIPALIIGGCTSTMGPVRVPMAGAPAPKAGELPPTITCPALPGDADSYEAYAKVSSGDRLRWLVCNLHARANANLDQSQQWQNRTEWRDIPLIGAATTVAGLLLFGRRDKTNNALRPGAQDWVSRLAFGSAAFATFANYLSPQKARDLLRQGARGHFCLATQGDLILSVYETLDRKDKRDELAGLVTNLSAALETDPDSLARPTEAKAIRDAALAALSTYDLQVRARDTAAIALEETAWNFGIDLLTRADREEPKVDSLVKAITDQTESVAKFAATEKKATDPTPAALVSAFAVPGSKLAPSNDQLALTTARKTAELLDGLVNVEALVLGFDKCTATALTGGTPKADRIQRVTLQ